MLLTIQSAQKTLLKKILIKFDVNMLLIYKVLKLQKHTPILTKIVKFWFR